MSTLNNLLAVAALVGTIEAAAACAEDCAVRSKDDENSPQLASADEVMAFCNENKAATLACLTVEEDGDGEKVNCSAPNYSCNSSGLQQNMDDLFAAGGGQYCVENPAELIANL